MWRPEKLRELIEFYTQRDPQIGLARVA